MHKYVYGREILCLCSRKRSTRTYVYSIHIYVYVCVLQGDVVFVLAQEKHKNFVRKNDDLLYQGPHTSY